ncbi:MAG: hypothetical protein H7249_04875 [Chitinophagaceae bacterium]|nr:hypothetical protein [Oligoflexus sp.]
MTNAQGSSTSSLKLLLLCCFLSAGIFMMTKGSPVSLLPIGLYTLGIVLSVALKRPRPDQDILLGFLILSFFVDDISEVAWGRTVDTWTEEAGALLFKSYGLTGMEVFAIVMAACLALSQFPRLFRDWYRIGLLNVTTVGFGVFIASLIAGVFGVFDGGKVNTMFIQIRFLHCLPLWVFIGFVVWRDRDFSNKALKWSTIMLVLKSIQAVFVYYTHYELYKQHEEYLVDHYFSGFAVIALVVLLMTLIRDKRFIMRLLCLASISFVSLAYLFNDRRTSYVGLAFALALLPVLMPFRIIRRFAIRGTLAIAGAVLFTMITWHMPAPLGFIGNLYRSFGTETGYEEPSYRDLENANLLHAVTSRPMTGIGYGKEFDEVFPMPDISYVYERYRMIPHNLFLASWAFGGPLTIAALSLLFAAMIATAGKLFQKAREPDLLLLGLVSLFYFLQYLTYTFGDLGFQIQRNQMMAGLLFGACFRIQAELTRETKAQERFR